MRKLDRRLLEEKLAELRRKAEKYLVWLSLSAITTLASLLKALSERLF